MLVMLGFASQTPAFLANSGQLVTPWFDAVSLHPQGIAEWTVIWVAVVTALSQHEVMDEVGDFRVGIVTMPHRDRL
jgi:hypothetical protein